MIGINKKEKIIVFGASKAGQNALTGLKRKYKIIAFCDNNKKLHGQSVARIKVVAPEMLDKLAWDKIIIASMYHKEIFRQLVNELNIPSCKIEIFNYLLDYSSFWSDFIEKITPNKIKFKRKQEDSISFMQASLAASIYEKEEINPNIIVYESYNGREFSCNPKAMLDYFIEHRSEYPDFIHVVALNDVEHPSVQYLKNLEYIKIIQLESEGYIRLAQTAKYHINNCSMRPYLIKHSEQIWITSWHASLLKKLANHTGRYWEGKNICRSMLGADYFISPNEFTTQKLFSAYGFEGLFQGEVLHTGYPRFDMFFRSSVQEIRRKLGVPDGKKIVLYGPTWRGQYEPDNTVIESQRIRYFIQSLLSDEYVVLIKYHSMVYPFLSSDDLECCVPLDIETNELLRAVDLLVSDFSGLIFDYLVTGNPFVLFALDFEEYYSSKQGLYISPEQFPVPFCKTLSELEFCIREYCAGRYLIPDYKEFAEQFVGLEDGKSTQRAIDYIFQGIKPSKGNVSLVQVSKPVVLLFVGDLADNGVTSSVLALSRHLDHDKYEIVYFISAFNSSQHKQVRLNPKGTFIYANNNLGYLEHEFSLREEFLKNGKLKDVQTFRSFAERERSRLFGKLKFDRIINFHGYGAGMALFLALMQENTESFIFLHNDLYQDYKTKNRFLLPTFRTYEFYHKLICVSEGSLKTNLEKVTPFVLHKFGFSIQNKMTHAINLIDSSHLEASAKRFTSDDNGSFLYLNNRIRSDDDAEEKVRVKSPDPALKSFIMIGRLSPEKGHIRFLEAFNLLHNELNTTELYIVGDGLIRREIELKIDELGLRHCVTLTGHLDNPYPLLERCDCLVLPSDYEGLGMVILEAFYFQKPVIASNISGCRDLIERYYGTLVERDVDAILQALRDFCDGKIIQPTTMFDVEEYNQNALKSFMTAVGLDS